MEFGYCVGGVVFGFVWLGFSCWWFLLYVLGLEFLLLCSLCLVFCCFGFGWVWLAVFGGLFCVLVFVFFFNQATESYYILITL